VIKPYLRLLHHLRSRYHRIFIIVCFFKNAKFSTFYDQLILRYCLNDSIHVPQSNGKLIRKKNSEYGGFILNKEKSLNQQLPLPKKSAKRLQKAFSFFRLVQLYVPLFPSVSFEHSENESASFRKRVSFEPNLL